MSGRHDPGRAEIYQAILKLLSISGALGRTAVKHHEILAALSIGDTDGARSKIVTATEQLDRYFDEVESFLKLIQEQLELPDES